jgi:hypothetical protein
LPHMRAALGRRSVFRRLSKPEASTVALSCTDLFGPASASRMLSSR